MSRGVANSTANEFTLFETWQEAIRHSSGYGDLDLVSNLGAQLRIQRPWSIERSADRYLAARSLELLFALQIAIANVGPRVRVADIGGGNGYMAYIARQELDHLQWDWTVFESPPIAAQYGVFEREAGVKWRPKFPESLSADYDVALLSCTLQYVADPYELLAIAASRCRYVLIMRLPLVSAGGSDLCSVQRPRGGVYEDSDASWPCWLFSRTRFDAFVQTLGEIVCRWVTTSETVIVEGRTIPLEGLLVRTRLEDLRVGFIQ